MDDFRFLSLERRVAVLEGKPDPGLPCPMAYSGRCQQGKTLGPYGDLVDCRTCGGKARVFPDLK